MRTVDAVVEILRREGVRYLPCFPTTSLIDAAAKAGIRPIVCRQERIGVGIADGFSRVTSGQPFGAFAMQYGPGAENSYAGVATAFSDSVPILLLPLGHAEDRQGLSRTFSATGSFASITKSAQMLTSAGRVGDVMRRAVASLREGRPGPALVEIPEDVAAQEVDEAALRYEGVRPCLSQADPRDVSAAARALCAAEHPVVHAGQGVLYAGATEELVELAELVRLPVMTTLLGKSAFPEHHALSLGCGYRVMSRALDTFVRRADVILGIGCSFVRHPIAGMPIPSGKTLVQVTNDPTDLYKEYHVDYPLLGDAKLVLRQLVDACRDVLGGRASRQRAVAAEIAAIDERWLADWAPKLTSEARPIDPYRVIWEMQRAINPADAIVTNDAGNPRDQLMPFYRSAGPRSFLGTGRSHSLGTGLGLIMGAKLARPDKVCINVMGDAAFGMVGMDFETAARNRIPIITLVFNNGGMATEGRLSPVAEANYQSSRLDGDYADLARAMGGRAERVEDPSQVHGAFLRARRVTEEEGLPVLLEFATAKEAARSWPRTSFSPTA